MSSSDMLQTAMAMNGIGGIELNARSFEIIEQPTPTVNKFRFVSELLKKPEQNKPLFLETFQPNIIDTANILRK